MDRKYHFGVAGAADCSLEEYRLAEEVGKKIAMAGATLVCGGRLGVMEAAAKGAIQSGGSTIGILPGLEKREANEYIEHIICTGMGQARNIIFVLSTDILIAVGGEWGTLSEIAIALKHRIPVIVINSWAPEDLNRQGLDTSCYYLAHDPSEAVDLAVNLVRDLTLNHRVVSPSDR